MHILNMTLNKLNNVYISVFWRNADMTFLMDYEGYTFVFFIKKINKFFLLKCDIYYALTFQP